VVVISVVVVIVAEYSFIGTINSTTGRRCVSVVFGEEQGERRKEIPRTVLFRNNIGTTDSGDDCDDDNNGG